MVQNMVPKCHSTGDRKFYCTKTRKPAILVKIKATEEASVEKLTKQRSIQNFGSHSYDEFFVPLQTPVKWFMTWSRTHVVLQLKTDSIAPKLINPSRARGVPPPLGDGCGLLLFAIHLAWAVFAFCLNKKKLLKLLKKKLINPFFSSKTRSPKQPKRTCEEGKSMEQRFKRNLRNPERSREPWNSKFELTTPAKRSWIWAPDSHHSTADNKSYCTKTHNSPFSSKTKVKK